MQYHNICNLHHLGMVKLNTGRMPAKRKQVCFKKKIKRWHNACKMQANVLAFCQSLVEEEIERWKNACKTQANVLAFCPRFARVCLKKKFNAGKTQAHNFLFSLEILWQNAGICELPGVLLAQRFASVMPAFCQSLFLVREGL